MLNMNKLFFITALIIGFQTTFAQKTNQPVPAVDLKTLDGKTINSATFNNGGKPMVINFWATWCKPCVRELTNIAEVYDDWVKETGVKVIAISIDDSRSMARVAPFVNGKDWSYEVYCDPNGDFQRAMNVINPPYTFLVDGNGKIVWQHTSYADGDENELYEQIKKLVKK
jgi:cytochrome c biogenesis protein CcmG, thiol:disulfide interchange protein DsbE